MTFKEWAERPDLIGELRSLLDTSVMKLALEVCTDVGIPRSKIPANAPNLMESNALLNSKREGYFEFLRNLKALATYKSKSIDEDDLAPWQYKSKIVDQ